MSSRQISEFLVDTANLPRHEVDEMLMSCYALVEQQPLLAVFL